MSRQLAAPTFEAKLWDGENTQEVLDFIAGQSWMKNWDADAAPHYDPETNMIQWNGTSFSGMRPNFWVVSAASYGGVSLFNAPFATGLVVDDATFQAAFPEVV